MKPPLNNPKPRRASNPSWQEDAYRALSKQYATLRKEYWMLKEAPSDPIWQEAYQRLNEQHANLQKKYWALRLDYESVLAAGKLEIEKRQAAQKACVEVRGILGMGKPWPLIDVLSRLALAAEHLLHGHDCDCQGHEDISGCIQKAREYSKAYYARQEMNKEQL